MMSTILDENRLNRLARQMQRGEEKAAEALYNELSGKVYGFCISRLRRKHLAEDITQEIFLKLVSRIETFDLTKGNFSVWFWQVARNTLFDHYRKQKNLSLSISFVDIGGEGEIEGLMIQDPMPALETRFERQELEIAMNVLTSEERQLFNLRYIRERSYKEIATVLTKSEGALRVAVSRLKRKIRKSFTRNAAARIPSL